MIIVFYVKFPKIQTYINFCCCYLYVKYIVKFFFHIFLFRVRKEEDRQIEEYVLSDNIEDNSVYSRNSNNSSNMNYEIDFYNNNTDITDNYIEVNDTVIKAMLNTMNEERYIDIYIFSALTVATVLITLFRTFLFFNVCLYLFNLNYKIKICNM